MLHYWSVRFKISALRNSHQGKSYMEVDNKDVGVIASSLDDAIRVFSEQHVLMGDQQVEVYAVNHRGKVHYMDSSLRS
jgi:hypothetical protein